MTRKLAPTTRSVGSVARVGVVPDGDRVVLRFRDDDDGGLGYATPSADIAEAAFRSLGIPDAEELSTRLLSTLAEAMGTVGRNAEVGARELNDALALIESIAPRDAVECLLAIQMVATHSAAMRHLMLAQKDTQTLHVIDAHTNRAQKLLRVYTAQVDALKRYRSTGKQTVIVKRVDVNEGGQAIVGNVEPGGGEGGS